MFFPSLSLYAVCPPSLPRPIPLSILLSRRFAALPPCPSPSSLSSQTPSSSLFPLSVSPSGVWGSEGGGAGAVGGWGRRLSLQGKKPGNEEDVGMG